MNQAQHIWLVIMTECAIKRCADSRALVNQWMKHAYRAGLLERVVCSRDGVYHWYWT